MASQTFVAIPRAVDLYSHGLWGLNSEKAEQALGFTEPRSKRRREGTGAFWRVACGRIAARMAEGILASDPGRAVIRVHPHKQGPP